jgi:hypothetical protein
MNALAGTGESAGIDYRDETAQQFEIKHGPIRSMGSIH